MSESVMASAILDLQKENRELRAEVERLTYHPHRCDRYPRCGCPSFEACLPMDAEGGD